MIYPRPGDVEDLLHGPEPEPEHRIGGWHGPQFRGARRKRREAKATDAEFRSQLPRKSREARRQEKAAEEGQ